jgi:hypothetical protein
MKHRHDPLEADTIARAIAGATLIGMASAVALSVTAAAPDQLPGIALGSPALLHLERALLVGGIVGAALMFLVRGWAGYYPSKLSTTGAEYPSLLALEQATESNRETVEALVALQSQHEEFAEQTARHIEALEERIETSHRIGSLTPSGT